MTQFHVQSHSQPSQWRMLLDLKQELHVALQEQLAALTNKNEEANDEDVMHEALPGLKGAPAT